MLKKNTVLLLRRCRCLSLCCPITIFQSSLIDGCTQRPIFQSPSSTSSYPKSFQNPRLSSTESTYRPFRCRLFTTKSSKHFMPTRFRHSTKSKHRPRFSKLSIRRTKMFSLAPQQAAARQLRQAPRSLFTIAREERRYHLHTGSSMSK